MFRCPEVQKSVPNLVEVARMVMAVSPSCIDVDRMFSLAKRIKTPLRNRLGAANFTRQMVLTRNSKFVSEAGLEGDVWRK